MNEKEMFDKLTEVYQLLGEVQGHMIATNGTLDHNLNAEKVSKIKELNQKFINKIKEV